MVDFQEMIDKATEAGNIAGTQWLEERIAGKYKLEGNHLVDMNGNRVNPILDSCGGAYIELKDRRTVFAKWLKKKENGNRVWSVDINHKFRGWQDMGLREAVIYAAYKVLTKDFGLTGLSYRSYID